MSHHLLPTSKLFQMTALTLSLALAGCGGGGTDTVAPEPDTGVQQPGTGNPDNSTNNASEIYISAEKNQLLTGSDKTTVSVRVTDQNGGIVGNVPVSINIADASLYGLSLSSTSNQVTDDQGLVAIDLVQTTVGIDSQLNHESLLTVVANGNNNIQQTLPILVSGTNVSNVVSSKNLVENGDNFSVSGQILDGATKPVVNADVVLYSNDEEAAMGRTDSNGKFI